MITIRMTISGEEIVFHRCSICEANTWENDAGVITLDDVLTLARHG
jgi:hypothetical protein